MRVISKTSTGKTVAYGVSSRERDLVKAEAERVRAHLSPGQRRVLAAAKAGRKTR